MSELEAAGVLMGRPADLISACSVPRGQRAHACVTGFVAVLLDVFEAMKRHASADFQADHPAPFLKPADQPSLHPTHSHPHSIHGAAGQGLAAINVRPLRLVQFRMLLVHLSGTHACLFLAV